MYMTRETERKREKRSESPSSLSQHELPAVQSGPWPVEHSSLNITQADGWERAHTGETKNQQQQKNTNNKRNYVQCIAHEYQRLVFLSVHLVQLK